MPLFLTRQQLYRIIQRELPEDVYPDGAPSAFFSTADSDATADVAATAYANLERIYDNFFPQLADEKIEDWEITVFGRRLSSSLTLEEKQDRVVTRLRERRSLSLFDVLTAVLEVLPEGTVVQLWERCHQIGVCWKLGVSKLGNGTFLGCQQPLILPDGSDYCDPPFYYWTLGVSKLGVNTRLAPAEIPDPPDTEKLSSRDWHNAQFHAYNYIVRIFETTLTAQQRADVEETLNRLEPARSVHTIQENASFATYHRETTVTDVDRFDNYDTLYKDPLSSTGYSGRTG